MQRESILNGKYPVVLAVDRESALATFRLFGGNPTFIVAAGEPRSKARPRYSGSGKSYDSSKQIADARRLRQTMAASFPKPLAGNVAIACTFYRSSLRRVDLDNLLKEVLDNAKGILWRDDMQVTACVGVLKMDVELPRTVIVVGRHNEPSLDRSNQDLDSVCRSCGAPFTWRKYPSAKRRVGEFCSLKCANRRDGRANLSAPTACRCCGDLFQRKNARSVLCSQACRKDEMIRRNKGSLR